MNFVVMGVAGCGKSTVAKLLASELQLDFLEGDDFHSDENVALMSAGVALTDKERLPWLQSINRQMVAKVKSDKGFVLSCSALKQLYRMQLAKDVSPLLFVYLRGSKALIRERVAARENHFMPLQLIDSQFSALQEPGPEESHITVSIDASVPDIVAEIMASLKA